MAANSKVGDIGDQPRFIDYRADGQLTLIGNLSDRGKIESTVGESTILSLGNILGRIDSGNPEHYTSHPTCLSDLVVISRYSMKAVKPSHLMHSQIWSDLYRSFS